MDGSIVLGRRQRNRLLDLYRKEHLSPAVRLRAHLILLLADRHPWSLICAVLFCSSATVARWKRRFEQGGVEALLQEQRGRRPVLLGWAALLVRWVKRHTPRDFGYCRSRWCCATLLLVLWDTQRVKVSAETVRRWLHASGLVWRRPRPVLGPADESRAWKLRKIPRTTEGFAGRRGGGLPGRGGPEPQPGHRLLLDAQGLLRDQLLNINRTVESRKRLTPPRRASA
jgi:putative transposase